MSDFKPKVKSWVSHHLECPVCKLLINIPETKFPQDQEQGDSFAFERVQKHLKTHSINELLDYFDSEVYRQVEKIREERKLACGLIGEQK